MFNKPLVESDLKDRVAKAVGISRARVEFKDEPGVDPAVLVKEDETFYFTWVRWTLSIGDVPERGVERDGQGGASAADEPLTFERLADCARRVVELGPGYALDSVKVAFGADGSVAGAVMDGLLPVKKSEQRKESRANVN